MITYIDMDGVLADFYTGCHNKMGVEVNGFPYKTGWNWVKELGCDFRNEDAKFWAELPIYEDAHIWLKKADGKIIIATTPCGSESILGKLFWIKKHFPELLDSVIFLKKKYTLAGRGKTLIDDNINQINSFKRHGGLGILVPRPWNE